MVGAGVKRRAERRLASRRLIKYDADWTFTQAMEHLPSERSRYRYFLWFHDRILASELRRHRAYFRDTSRAFGEDAFHAMWFKLFQEFRPMSAVEIGVYRGQTLTLWLLIARYLGIATDVWVVTPLSSLGDS